MTYSIDPHIKFTKEPKKDKQIAFLNMLISRRTDFISIHDYRKPTHTDRYLDNAPQHDIKQNQHRSHSRQHISYPSHQ